MRNGRWSDQQKWDRMWALLYPGIPVPDDPNRHRKSPVVYLVPTHTLLTRPSVFNPETPRQRLREVHWYRAEYPRVCDEIARLQDENFQLHNQLVALGQTPGAAEQTFQNSQAYHNPSNNGISSDRTPAMPSHTDSTGQLPYYSLNPTLADAQYDNYGDAMASQLEHYGQPAMPQWQQYRDPSSSFSEMGHGTQNQWSAQGHGAMNDQAGDGNDNNNVTLYPSVRADDSSRLPDDFSRDPFMGYESTSDTEQDPSEQPPTQSNPTQFHVGMVPSVVGPAIGGAADFMNPSDWLTPQSVQAQYQQRADGIQDQFSGHRAAHGTPTDTDYSVVGRGFSSPSFTDTSYPFGSHRNNGVPAPRHLEENIHDLVRENGQAAGPSSWRNGQREAHPRRNNGMGQ